MEGFGGGVRGGGRPGSTLLLFLSAVLGIFLGVEHQVLHAEASTVPRSARFSYAMVERLQGEGGGGDDGGQKEKGAVVAIRHAHRAQESKGSPALAVVAHNRSSVKAAASLLPKGVCATAGMGMKSGRPSAARAGKYHKSLLWPRMQGKSAREQKYIVQVPKGYDPSKPVPLLMTFHGWGGSAWRSAVNKEWQAKSDELGVLVVSPDGIGDYDEDGPTSEANAGARDDNDGLPVEDKDWTSWGLHFQGEDGEPRSSRELNARNYKTPTCVRATQPEAGYCYDSCRPHCNGCSWATCEDTVAYVLDILQQVRKDFCVDERRVFALGYSAGGMFVYTLARDTRSRQIFSAVASIAGSPLRDFPTDDVGLPVLAVWGAQDRVVPPMEHQQRPLRGLRQGELDDFEEVVEREGLVLDNSMGNAWIYQSMDSVVSRLRVAHGCEGDAEVTPLAVYDLSSHGGVPAENSLKCGSFRGCEATFVHCICEDCKHWNIVQKVGTANFYWQFFLEAAKAQEEKAVAGRGGKKHTFLEQQTVHF